MSFLLGSFTSGMFSGLNDVQDAFIKNEKYKQEKMETQRQQDMMDAARATGDAAKTQHALDTSGAGAPQAGTSGSTFTPPSSSSSSSSAPVKSENLPDINLNSVQKPDYMNPSAISSTARHMASEQNGYGDASTPATGTMPGGQPVGGVDTSGRTVGLHNPANNPAASSPPEGGASNRFSPSNEQANAPSMPSWATPTAASPAAAQPGRTVGLHNPTNNPVQAHAPSYANPNSAPEWGPRRAITPWGQPQPQQSVAPQVSQNPGTPTVPGANPSPMQGAPSLASSTAGLGSQILAAMNPTAGSTA